MVDAADDDARPNEHDVLVVLRLGNRQMGTAQERLDIERLAGELEAAVVAAGAGEYDGDEFGGGECTLFFAGKDADKLYAVLAPLLKRAPCARGATILRQYGDGTEPVHSRL
jgi:hypothetical protein